MQASIRLKWYQYKRHYFDFLKVLFGIVGFEALILYIQKKGFLENFETTRMTLFLLLFSTGLLILVQTSISISRERSILERDFFSGLSRLSFSIASLLFESINAVIEALVFVLAYLTLAFYFAFDLPEKGSYFQSFLLEVFITVVLVYLSSHFIALLVSVLTGNSEISSVILAVIIGIVQFSLAGTILQLPKAISKFSALTFLSYGHKVFGMSNDLYHLPSVMAKFHIPIEKGQLNQFKASHAAILGDWSMLAIHAVAYALIFMLLLIYRKK